MTGTTRNYTIDEQALDPWPGTDALYSYLGEVVSLLNKAVSTGMKHVQDPDQSTTDQVIQDCEETLDVIMEGNVKEWIN